MMAKIGVIFGDQLFRKNPLFDDCDELIMVESFRACARLPYHKQKLVFLLSSMRSYADEIRKQNLKLHYYELDPDTDFSDILKKHVSDTDEIVTNFMPNKATAEGIQEIADQIGCTITITDTSIFFEDPVTITNWVSTHMSSQMETYYRKQRKAHDILMDGKNPVGGEWNYDDQNRKPLPKNRPTIPDIPKPFETDHDKQVEKLIENHFPDNPGQITHWLPTTHARAEKWLDSFIDERFELFGEYEDAMAEDESFLFHAIISPLLNNGLLTPHQVINSALSAYANETAPLNAVEGFIRQVIGWRDYMYGHYAARNDSEWDVNYFGFSKQLEDWWYTNSPPDSVPLPVRTALDRAHHYGYNHHIERLMILGNWFLLNEYDPHSVLRWFSSLYIDAYDWVMLPNVLGMSQYADGGTVATKPYISGGNYLQKMGSWWPTKQEARDSEFTELYWKFLQNNYEKLKDNHRMSLVLNQAKKRKESS